MEVGGKGGIGEGREGREREGEGSGFELVKGVTNVPKCGLSTCISNLYFWQLQLTHTHTNLNGQLLNSSLLGESSNSLGGTPEVPCSQGKRL